MLSCNGLPSRAILNRQHTTPRRRIAPMMELMAFHTIRSRRAAFRLMARLAIRQSRHEHIAAIGAGQCPFMTRSAYQHAVRLMIENAVLQPAGGNPGLSKVGQTFRPRLLFRHFRMAMSAAYLLVKQQ